MMRTQSFALALCVTCLPCFFSCTRSDAARAENAKKVIAAHQPVIAPPQPPGRQKNAFGYLGSALPARLFLQGPSLEKLQSFSVNLSADQQAVRCLEKEAKGLQSLLLATTAREDFLSVQPAALWILQTERSTEQLRTCLSKDRKAQEPLHANSDYFGGRFHRRLGENLVIVRDGPFYLLGSRSEIEAALKRELGPNYPLKKGVMGQLQFAAESHEKVALRLVKGSKLRLSFQLTDSGVLIETRFEEQKLQTDEVVKASKRSNADTDSGADRASVALEDEIISGEALANQAKLTLAFKEDLRDFYRAHAEQFSWLLAEEASNADSAITLNALAAAVMAGKVHAPDDGLYLEFLLPKGPFLEALSKLLDGQLAAVAIARVGTDEPQATTHPAKDAPGKSVAPQN